jgi:hypothetical protein
MISVFISCEKSTPQENLQPYGIDATLKPDNSKDKSLKGFGLVKFRQDPDTARIIALDTYLYGLQPNHDYLLQRAVNPITDASCTSTVWLTLGKGLVAQAIHTNNQGDGEENLFRDVTSIARGTQFHIHFQIIDAVTLATVLSSDCYEYTVR